MNVPRVTRRSIVRGSIAATLAARIRPASAQTPLRFALPIGLPDRIPGDGFLIRHGYACENIWYNAASCLHKPPAVVALTWTDRDAEPEVAA